MNALKCFMCRFRAGLCGRSAVLLDCAMILSLFGFGVVLSLDANDLFKQHIYHKFQALPTMLLIGAMFFVAIFQAACRLFSQNDLILGFARVVMGGMWVLIFAAFFATYPPLNTGMVFSAVYATLAGLSGREQILCAYRQQACERILKGR